MDATQLIVEREYARYPLKNSVTVVIPLYNGAPYIEFALRSLCEQTFKSFDVVVIDDGSRDGGVELVESFAETDRRVKAIRQKHRGVIATLNTGCTLATGDYIARRQNRATQNRAT